MFGHLVEILVPATSAFVIGVALTPLITHYLYKYKAWKKTPGKLAFDGTEAVEFNRIHKHTTEARAPRMGGVVIWLSVVLTTLAFSFLAAVFNTKAWNQLNFLDRSETWIPLASLIVGAITGLIDDVMTIQKSGKGLRLRLRLGVVLLLSTFIGVWFYVKLGVAVVNIPFGSPLYLGWLIVPLFVLVSVAIYASGVIDGIDGLSGGVFASIFAAYAIIAAAQFQTDLAAFCAAVVGSILAFLWFNVPPARFYMSDTGTMALTLTLSVVAFMTDALGGGVGVSVLPIIGFILVVTVISNIAQIAYKKMFHKKLLRIAPLHHHFEAIGWPGYKVTMRYWILSVICAVVGVIVALQAIG